jgi:hypothetical protein
VSMQRAHQETTSTTLLLTRIIPAQFAFGLLHKAKEASAIKEFYPTLLAAIGL